VNKPDDKSLQLDKRQIARQFSRAAETYDAVAQLQRAMSQRLLEALPTSPTGTLVDFGCGTGESLLQLARTTQLSLVGIDIAEGMIDVARRKAAELHNPLATRLEFRVADFEATGVDSNSVDFVFSNAAIQWSDLSTVLNEMRRVIRAEGCILVSTFGPKTLHELREACHALGDPWPRIHKFLTIQEVQQAVSNAGFFVSAVDSSLNVIHYPSVKSCFAAIKLLGATNALKSRSRSLMSRHKFLALQQQLQQQWPVRSQPQLTFEPIYIWARCK
jgi:malonyl-CoA O-methyltransferase